MKSARFYPLEIYGLMEIGYYPNYIMISILLKQSVLGALPIFVHWNLTAILGHWWYRKPQFMDAILVFSSAENIQLGSAL